MKCKRGLWLLISLLWASQVVAGERPNVVLIMTDNHGAWTLGCYGNPEIRTPNIDRLAREGTLFEQAFSSNPVCSPTRATFLTGLIPSQHGVHCFLFGGRLQVGPQARCTLDRFTSFPEILKRRGYDCGLVGKWHLGDNLRPQEGLTDYWITTPHGGTSTFYGAPIIENGKVRNEPQYLTDFWTDHAVKYIESKAEAEKPFFLFLSYNGPYSLGRLLLREGKNRHAAYYRDKDLKSFSSEAIHPWQYNNRDYQTNDTSHRRVATEVSGVDDGVGRVMRTLKENGLDDNTLVVFVADQGWSGGHGGFYGMGDHTRPTTATDPMMRIPMIWRQPGQVAANRRSRRMVTNYDFLPTLLTQLEMQEDQPTNPPTPGVNFAQDLKPDVKLQTAADRSVFYEFENLRCIRTARWKFVERFPNGPNELFDLRADPTEFDNLIDDENHVDVASRLRNELHVFYNKHAAPEFDMWRGGGSQTRVFIGVPEHLADQEPVKPPAPPEGFQPQPLKVPKGFTVELAAAPPLVTHPTMACLDDRGRLYVCNNAGVNMSAKELETELPNSIRMLEDRDGDGRFDRSTVFADKMTFPMGGVWLDGALYVASPPNIWRLEDTNDDGVADKREVIVSQFGYTGNAASIHGCFFGPDGRLYWCDGYHGHEFRDEKGQLTSKREGSYLFSCWPDGSDVRIHCGGGMDNPVEVDFTSAGDVIGSVNILYSRPREDCQVHWLYGGAYPHRERVLKELKTTGPVLEPMHRFGHVAVSGTTKYRSGVLDHRWTDNFFATFFNSGKVVRLEMKPNGSTYEAQQREFLSSPSHDFHPTDVLEDADGSLLVVDTGGWFYRGCPTSQLAKPEVLGAIYRVRRDRMTTLPDPLGTRVDMRKSTTAQLIAALNATRHSVRERAIQELGRRTRSDQGAAVVAALRTCLARRDVRARLGAVWALTRGARDGSAATDKSREALRLALKDRSAEIRQAACHAIAQNPDPTAVDALHSVLVEDTPAVRRVAADALGRIGAAKSVGPLLDAVEHAVDRSEQHAIVYALISIGEIQPLLAALKDTHPERQAAALTALDQIDDATISAAMIEPLLMANWRSPAHQAAWRVFQSRASSTNAQENNRWVMTAKRLIERAGDVGKEDQGATAVLTELVRRYGAHETIAAVVAQKLQQSEVSSSTRQALLSGLSQTRADAMPQTLQATLRKQLSSTNDVEAVSALVEAIGGFRKHEMTAALKTIGSDTTRPSLLRVAALRAANGATSRLDPVSFKLLLETLQASEQPQQRNQAIQQLGGASLTAEQLQALAPMLVDLGPLGLRELMRPFQRNTSVAVGSAFLDAMEKSPAFASVPVPEYSDVVKRYPAELRERANRLLEQLRVTDAERAAKLDRLLGKLETGDATRGAEVFRSMKSKCSTCHRVRGQGGMIGPDLTTIGANRSPEDLLESIVYPSASIVRQYDSHRAELVDGRLVTGLLVAENESSLTLQPQTGEPIEIPLAQIERLSQSPVSLMPKGVEQTLSDTEIADVIAWLKTLK